MLQSTILYGKSPGGVKLNDFLFFCRPRRSSLPHEMPSFSLRRVFFMRKIEFVLSSFWVRFLRQFADNSFVSNKSLGSFREYLTSFGAVCCFGCGAGLRHSHFEGSEGPANAPPTPGGPAARAETFPFSHFLAVLRPLRGASASPFRRVGQSQALRSGDWEILEAAELRAAPARDCGGEAAPRPYGQPGPPYVTWIG